MNDERPPALLVWATIALIVAVVVFAAIEALRPDAAPATPTFPPIEYVTVPITLP